jgi:Ca2+-binding RTX toxin-like protein
MITTCESLERRRLLSGGAFGYASSGDGGDFSFGGTTVHFTRYGDANRDGKITTADFNALARNFMMSGKSWADGDFNYDGLVSLGDFNLLAGNFWLPAYYPNGLTAQAWARLEASVLPDGQRVRPVQYVDEHGTLVYVGTSSADRLRVDDKLLRELGKRQPAQNVRSIRFDGLGGNDQIEVLAKLRATIAGGSGDDYLVGGRLSDSISGGAGNDTLRGMRGNDTLLGNAGNDMLIGDAGRDRLVGGAGQDKFKASDAMGNQDHILTSREGDSILSKDHDDHVLPE